MTRDWPEQTEIADLFSGTSVVCLLAWGRQIHLIGSLVCLPHPNYSHLALKILCDKLTTYSFGFSCERLLVAGIASGLLSLEFPVVNARLLTTICFPLYNENKNILIQLKSDSKA